MKIRRILGYVCLILAVILIATAIVGQSCKTSTGALGDRFSSARENEAATELHLTVRDKTAPSAIKKANAALTSTESAMKDAEKVLNNLVTLTEKAQNGALGDQLVDLLIKSTGDIADGVATAAEIASSVQDEALSASLLALLTDISASEKSVSDAASKMALALFTAETAASYKSVSGIESKMKTAVSGISDVFSGIGIAYEAPGYSSVRKYTPSSPMEALQYASTLLSQAKALHATAEGLCADAQRGQEEAEAVCAEDSVPFSDSLILLIGRDFIGVMLTGVIFLVIGLVLLFLHEQFLRAWKGSPVFSTFIAALVMIAIQTYSLGFEKASYGEWGSFWLNNMLNVLRSNSSVGMVALGMTFVIITGGIDLAVGSSLAGVATVVMVLLDVSSHGVLVNAGITGMPNYIIAIAAGLLTGVAIGALTGLGITKGRIPPFIITLGIMNIVRSVAQYFTKSYKTEVPKAFQALANQEIVGGQMLLPIIYWLVLAVIMYVISRHTAFGRHIYAVGSNERTSRLSGINVNAVKMKVYTLMGLIVAIAAITSVARLRGVDVASAGSGLEMNAIAAVVVGGTSMAGGRGSIIGTVLGVLIIGIMNNLLLLLHIESFLSNAFTGAIIIFAVLLQRKDK